MARLALALFVFGGLGSALGHASTTCPWLTTGTAERFLGGEVLVATNVDGSAGGSCSFTRHGDTGNATFIEILAGAIDTHPCPQESVKVKALGNEAVQCRHSLSASSQSDQIAGRIRKTFFVVTIANVPGATKKEPSDPRLNDAYGVSVVERLAELVVGNLY
jgi:hypothetical protein